MNSIIAVCNAHYCPSNSGPVTQERVKIFSPLDTLADVIDWANENSAISTDLRIIENDVKPSR